jgi:hypothetical protein
LPRQFALGKGFLKSPLPRKKLRIPPVRGRSLLQLLSRLDQAIDKALTLGIFTNEINR